MDKYSSKYQYIIWVDCDCYFTNTLDRQLWIKTFEDYAIIYHHGKAREKKDSGFETGLLGFQLETGGKKLFNRIVDCYETKTYRKYSRWDDGYIIKRIIFDNRQIPTLNLTPESKVSNVLSKDSPFSDYIQHDKGKHYKLKVNV